MISISKKSATIATITFFAFFGVSMFFTSRCTSNNEEQKLVNVGDTITSEGKVMVFEYNNHKFINIIKPDEKGNPSESYVVHDPNCKCLTKKLNNITTVITNTDNHNTSSSDSIVKANFRVVIDKLTTLQNQNNSLYNEVKVLRSEVNRLKSQNNKTGAKKVAKPITKTKKK